MPHTLWYTLHRLPDLSLAAYSALPNSQHEALLAQFAPSLRMLHRLALSYSLELRWWAHYDPQRPSGQRLELALGFAGQLADLEQAPIDAMLRATPIAPYFVDAADGLQRGSIQAAATPSPAPRLVGCQAARLERYWALTELGDEAFQRQSQLPAYLHAVYPWEANEGCRLVPALQLMQQLGEACVITMALQPSEGEQEYDRLQPYYASALAKLAGGSYKDALGRTEFIKAGPVAEQLRSLRQDLMDKIRCEPCFSMQLRCYASTRDKARMLTDTVLAEALSNGPHTTWPLPVESDYFAPAPADMLCLPPPEGVGLPADLQRLSGVFTLSEVASLFRLPVLYEGEALDLRKETYPGIDTASGRSLHLGQLHGAGSAGESVHIPLDALVKHTIVVGVPGSGKTNTLLGMANQVWGQFGVPFLALEPAKREYRGLLNLPACSGQVLLFAPGRAAPREWLLEGEYNPLALQINPFEMPVGYSLAEHCTNLMAVFKGAFGLYQPLPSMVEAALITLYAERGWQTGDLANARRVAQYGFPAMPRFVELLREQADKTDFIGENAATVRAGLEYRFGRLIDGPLASVFGAQRSTLRPEDWLRLPAIVELESLGESNGNFLSLLLLTYLREALTVRQEQEREQGHTAGSGYKLKHLLFLEEAHNLIGPSATTGDEEKGDPKAAATAYIVKMLAEVRALGQGIVIGDQLPSNLAPEVLKNTSVRICHRLTAPDDRGQMQQSMNASDLQFEQMANQTSGYALVSLEGVRKPFSVKVAAADGSQERHNQAISDQAFYHAVCRHVPAPGASVDMRFAANGRRLLEAAYSDIGILPWKDKQLSELNKTLPILVEKAEKVKDDDAHFVEEAMSTFYVNGLLTGHVVKDHLARCVRLSVRYKSWLSAGSADAATIQDLDETTKHVQSQLYQIRQNLDLVHNALIQANPMTAEFLDEFYIAWRIAVVFNPSAKGYTSELHELPKHAERSVRWYAKALQYAGTWPAQTQMSRQRQDALAGVHYGIWNRATAGKASQTQQHNREQRAKPHLVQAANLGSALASSTLDVLKKTGGESASLDPRQEK